MTKTKTIWQILCLIVCVLFWEQAFGAGEGPAVGSTLPSFTLPAPISQDDLQYLGLKKAGRFSLSEIEGKLIIIEVVNAL